MTLQLNLHRKELSTKGVEALEKEDIFKNELENLEKLVKEEEAILAPLGIEHSGIRELLTETAEENRLHNVVSKWYNEWKDTPGFKKLINSVLEKYTELPRNMLPHLKSVFDEVGKSNIIITKEIMKKMGEKYDPEKKAGDIVKEVLE